jgi:hypothetical protein
VKVLRTSTNTLPEKSAVEFSMELTTLIIGAVAGAFSGCGGTLLWELWLRPRRARRSLARALAAETGRNLLLIHAHRVAREHGKIGVPLDFRLGRAMFNAQAANIGDLPQPALGLAIGMYDTVDYLNEGVQRFSQLLSERDRHPSHTPEYRDADRSVIAAREAWHRLLDRGFDQANDLIRALHDWAEKGLGGEKFKMADEKRLRAGIVNGLRARETAIHKEVRRNQGLGS